MADFEVVVEAKCPKCGHEFTEYTTVDIEPVRNEGWD